MRPPRTSGGGVVVVGSGLRFLSGISVYTHQLARELSASRDVAVILMDRLVPTRLYPGAARVGAGLSSLSYDDVEHQHVDWFWWGSLRRAVALLARRRPRALVLQWWTAATAHTYLALALAARALGVKVVVEFHEVQDPGEAKQGAVAWYGMRALRVLARLADGFLVHHEADRAALGAVVDLGRRPVEVAPHPPYGYLAAVEPEAVPELAHADDADTTFLLFGVIRPRKGLETAAAAFHALPRDVASQARLLVVGEVWEGLEDEVERARHGRHGDRVVVIDRYVSDAEAAACFGAADVLLLPYLESSSSGPLAIGQAFGMPFLHSDLPSLAAAVEATDRTAALPAGDVAAWSAGLREACADWAGDRRRRTPTAADWSPMVAAYDRLLLRMGAAS